MPFKIVRNDITKMKVDAIVNTANEAPRYSTGVDYAIYKAAGEEKLLEARRKIGFLNEGDVAITAAYNLPAKYIMHAVSPFYYDGESGEEMKLRSCYRKSLEFAYEYKCESIAFPLIATGGFGYPKEEGMRIAVDEIHAFLLTHEMLIYLVVFDRDSVRLGFNIYPDLEAYIDQNYVREKREVEYGNRFFTSARKNAPGYNAYTKARDWVERKLKVNRIEETKVDMFDEDEIRDSAVQPMTSTFHLDYNCYVEERESALEERMKHLSDTFQEYLLYLIESKGYTNAEVYKRAIVSKKLFSKLKLNPDYHPDKSTAMRLCVGARLNLDETKDLLARAGYALSPCDKRDIIFSFFIEKEIFDMIEIDIALEEYGLPCFIE